MYPVHVCVCVAHILMLIHFSAFEVNIHPIAGQVNKVEQEVYDKVAQEVVD